MEEATILDFVIFFSTGCSTLYEDQESEEK